MKTINDREDKGIEGIQRPAFWAQWSPWRRTRWLVDEGHAADTLAAVELLKRLGGWPTEAELGLVGGRAPLPPLRTLPTMAPPRVTRGGVTPAGMGSDGPAVRQGEELDGLPSRSVGEAGEWWDR